MPLLTKYRAKVTVTVELEEEATGRVRATFSTSREATAFSDRGADAVIAKAHEKAWRDAQVMASAVATNEISRLSLGNGD